MYLTIHVWLIALGIFVFCRLIEIGVEQRTESAVLRSGTGAQVSDTTEAE